jgi:hypothetical protein
MIPSKRWHYTAVVIFSIGLSISRVSVAQSRAPFEGTHSFETRSELQAQANTAEAAGREIEARLIRYRLERGDFQEGDRILVNVRGPGGFSDTLTVRSGQLLDLPQIPALPLGGVLRSELLLRLSIHLSKYLRQPVITVRPLLRVGILGHVIHPGYYYTSADLPLSDVLMSAGGPAPDANLSKVSVRRGAQVILDERNTRTALTAGRSMDMLHMQAGDEIQVGQQRQFNWPIIVSSATGLIGVLIAITHR